MNRVPSSLQNGLRRGLTGYAARRTAMGAMSAAQGARSLSGATSAALSEAKTEKKDKEVVGATGKGGVGKVI